MLSYQARDVAAGCSVPLDMDVSGFVFPFVLLPHSIFQHIQFTKKRMHSLANSHTNTLAKPKACARSAFHLTAAPISPLPQKGIKGNKAFEDQLMHF